MYLGHISRLHTSAIYLGDISRLYLPQDGYQPTGLRHEHDIVGDYPQGQSTDDLSDGDLTFLIWQPPS